MTYAPRPSPFPLRRALTAAALLAACASSPDASSPDASAPDASAPDAPDAARPTPRPPPPGPPPVQRSCVEAGAVGCGNAWIGGGTFTLGDPEAYDFNARGNRAEPVQPNIRMSGFWIGRYEVSVSRFRRFVAAMGGTMPKGVTSRDTQPQRGCVWLDDPTREPALESHPMNCVDWPTARAFCAWDTPGGDLPTEAQWEFAARGPESRPWPWSADADVGPAGRVCWQRLNPPACDVDDARYADGRTPEGLFHLSGNVDEWTLDEYRPYFDSTCWTAEPRTDPLCPVSGDAMEGRRTTRGGHYYASEGRYVRAAARDRTAPNSRFITLGMRCATPVR